MSRRDAREIALKSLFTLDFTPEQELAAVIELSAAEVPHNSKADRVYARQLVQGAVENKTVIDEELEKLSPNWKVARMSVLNSSLLRLAAYEMFYSEDKVPPAVAINEVVELAKMYGTDESPAFVNGILGKMVKNHA